MKFIECPVHFGQYFINSPAAAVRDDDRMDILPAPPVKPDDTAVADSGCAQQDTLKLVRVDIYPAPVTITSLARPFMTSAPLAS